MELTINVERFQERLDRLHTHFISQKSTVWGGADALCIPFGSANEDLVYSKSSAFHLYLFGYEDFTDSLILISKEGFYFMSSTKKCNFLQNQLSTANSKIPLTFLERTKDEGMNRENFNKLLGAVRKNGGKKLGSLFKDTHNGNFMASWMDAVSQSQLEQIEIGSSLGLFLAIKDEHELETCKKAAILTNKIMKHGFMTEMENVIENDTQVSHSSLAKKVESIILDPAKINIKITADTVESCFEPIIQSGGKYDLKLSASSNTDNLSANVIICSLGARYKNYCSAMSRTFLVDPPAKVEKLYTILIALYNKCLEQMINGNDLKSVYEEAKNYLSNKDPSLLNHLPKSLGFSMGLEFRDSSLVLNSNNTNKFVPGMVFNLSVGFHNVPLSEEDKKASPSSVKKLSVFSLLIADVVMVQADGVPEVLTKLSKEYNDVLYTTADENQGEENEDEDDDEEEEEETGNKRTSRRRQDREVSELASTTRMKLQQDIMKKKLEEGRSRIKNGGGWDTKTEDFTDVEAKDLKTYDSPAEFPNDLLPNRLKIDMDREAILIPVNGRHVPFHASTIKNMTPPDPDMRINFYIPGTSLGKEAVKNIQYLVAKHGEKYVFIKELTFRSNDNKNLNLVYQQFQELRKRIRQREQRLEQEKDLVAQEKLIRIKDQRVPRLQDVTMRPQLSGKKCVGTLEAHQNGLRFTSSKGEILDVMYANIKHAILQPCDRSTMVLVHFHLKDPILIARKKQKDVQFFTEVISSSVNIDGVRNFNYDPDEIEEEKREREMKKRLNIAFREFCMKVQKVAEHYNYTLQIDAPYRKSAFEGNWSKEMVLIQPTQNCLVSLTEWPPLIITLSDVEHVHFERITYATKHFDMTFIFKNWDILPKTITSIDTKYLDDIQDWLNLIEITCTKGPHTINWNDVMKVVREEKDIFYDDHDEEGEPKPAGWLFLSADASDEEDDDEENEDSSFESAEEESESDYDSDESDLEDESDYSSYDEDEEEALEEKGQSWDELEREAKVSDKTKRNVDEVDDKPKKKARK